MRRSCVCTVSACVQQSVNTTQAQCARVSRVDACMYRGILLFTVCGSLSVPAQLKHEVEWLRRYGKVDSESNSDLVLSDCECVCVCIALICLICVHVVWCVGV